MRAFRVTYTSDGKPLDFTNGTILSVLLFFGSVFIMPIVWLVCIFDSKWVTEETYYLDLKRYAENKLKEINNK